jgi:hypothetical protein
MTPNDNLAERYGRPNRTMRPATLVLAGSLLAGFFGFAIYANFFANPSASVEIINYESADDHHMVGNFTARTSDRPASCVFKAYATRGNVVGFVELEIPANTSDAKPLQVVVKTLEPASVLRADGCRVK